MVDWRIQFRSSMMGGARWDGFRFRPGDIVISAPPKSGTTWLQMICAVLVFQTVDLPAPLTRLSPWLDHRLRPVEEIYDQLEKQTHRRFIKTHMPLAGLPVDDRVTYLVVGRDPRDAAVSLHHQRNNMRWSVIQQLVRQLDLPVPEGGSGRPPAPTEDVRESLLEWMNSEGSARPELVTLQKMVWHLDDAWSRRRDPNVVLLHYSDLSRDLEAEMRRLAGRLGITVPERTWPALVEAATFERMREGADDLVPDDGLGILKDSSKFFRSGSSGQWLRWFTADDLARYEALVAALAPPDLVYWMHHGTRPDQQ